MNNPPKPTGGNGHGKHVTNKEIKKRIEKLREQYIKKIDQIKKKKGNTPK